MNKMFIYASAAILALSAITASASPAVSGILAGGNVGFGTLNTFDNQPTNSRGFEITTGDVSWGLYGGYNYAINPNVLLGGQAGYNNYGTAKYSIYAPTFNNFKIQSNAWDLLATATYLWENNINVFAKGGASLVTQHMTGSLNGVTVGDQSNVVPEVAVGTGYVYKRFNINLEYRHIFGSGQTNFNDTFNNNGTLVPTGFNSVASIDAIYFGLSYLFPT